MLSSLLKENIRVYQLCIETVHLMPVFNACIVKYLCLFVRFQLSTHYFVSCSNNTDLTQVLMRITLVNRMDEGRQWKLVTRKMWWRRED